VQAGDVIPFSETHCEQMIEQGETLQFETRPFDVDEKEYGTDVGFEMYVGTPVYENDTVYGSLCFLDREQALPFDDWQLTMVELMGNWMGYELNRKHLLEERQQELRRQETKFEEFVQSVDNYAIFALDTEGLVTSWNPGAEQIKGYTEEEIVGEHFEVFYPEEHLESNLPAELLAEAAENGQVHHEGWRVRKDGTQFWADVTIAARYDEHGEHIGYTKIVQDLTEQRAHERALERERERLEFLNRIIRHNLLNGLNLINARTELLDSQFADEPSAREHVETIQTRIEDMSSLIDTMRTFMDAVLTGADHETRPMPIRDELDEKVQLARESYEDAVFDTHDLPDESTRVIADELLGEVFENVLSNAVIHNDKETPTVEVWTSETTCEIPVDEATGEPVLPESDAQLNSDAVREQREALTVHIADNGPGIPDDQKEAVLQKGVSELSEPGNGFGLYLVKEMLDAYGGSVDIRDAEDGDGTVFDLTFLVQT
jgi:PAS domain S-box-containing protein